MHQEQDRVPTLGLKIRQIWDSVVFTPQICVEPYFDDRVTQGFVESINRAIRGIINRAFGYRNFGNFRLQVLVECAGG